MSHRARAIMIGAAAAALGLGVAMFAYENGWISPAAPEAITVAAQPAPEPPIAAQDQSPPLPNPMAGRYLKQAAILLGQHNIIDARRYYDLAYAAGDGTAAVLLWKTYDPQFLDAADRSLANPDKAREWLERAETSTDPRAKLMLQFVRGVRSASPAPAAR